VIDALGVRKDADGEVQTLHASQLSGDEAVAEQGGVFDEEAWDVVEEIPKDTAALLVLLEHRWAIGLRDAIAAPAGSAWPRSSSARWTWSRSDWCRPTAAPSEADWTRRSQMLGANRRVARRSGRRTGRRTARRVVRRRF
jgi:hypothetical protein